MNTHLVSIRRRSETCQAYKGAGARSTNLVPDSMSHKKHLPRYKETHRKCDKYTQEHEYILIVMFWQIVRS